MQTEVREISPVLVEVNVEVPWTDVKADLDKTYKEVARTARIRGFRQGKAPSAVVRQVYGKQVRAQVTGNFVELGLVHAMQDHDLNIVAQPQLKEQPDLEDGASFKFRAEVEVRPKITAVDFAGIEAWRRPIEIEATAIDAEVERLREQHADIRQPEPMRAARESDLITIDYTVDIDGTPREDFAAQGRQVPLTDDQLIKELRDGLIGMSPGDSKDIAVTFADDYHNEELRGKSTMFHVTASDVHERLLPDADDEFAKDCGDFADLSDLRSKIRENLEASLKGQADHEVREQLIDGLVNRNPIAVPPTMVKQQRQQMLQEMLQMLQYGGMSGFPPNFFEDIEQRAERRVRGGLLLSSLSRIHDIQVEEKDVDARLNEIAAATGQPIGKVKSDYSGQRRESLEGQILEQKLIALVENSADIKVGVPPEPIAPAPFVNPPHGEPGHVHMHGDDHGHDHDHEHCDHDH